MSSHVMSYYITSYCMILLEGLSRRPCQPCPRGSWPWGGGSGLQPVWSREIAWLKLYRKFPMGLGTPPLKLKILLGSNPLTSRILVRRLAVDSNGWTWRGTGRSGSPIRPEPNIMIMIMIMTIIITIMMIMIIIVVILVVIIIAMNILILIWYTLRYEWECQKANPQTQLKQMMTYGLGLCGLSLVRTWQCWQVRWWPSWAQPFHFSLNSTPHEA